MVRGGVRDRGQVMLDFVFPYKGFRHQLDAETMLHRDRRRGSTAQ